MKVNITGSGNIPGVNKNAPAYNLDLEKSQISRILNFRQFRVFGVGTGLITRANLDAAFDASIVEAKKEVEAEAPKPVVEKKSEPKKVAKKEKIVSKPVEAPIIEPAIPEPIEVAPIEEEPVVVGVDLAQNDDVVVEAPAVEEVPADEGFPVDDIVDEDTPAVEEEVVEEKEAEFRPRNKKKNKKNRNND